MYPWNNVPFSLFPYLCTWLQLPSLPPLENLPLQVHCLYSPYDRSYQRMFASIPRRTHRFCQPYDLSSKCRIESCSERNPSDRRTISSANGASSSAERETHRFLTAARSAAGSAMESRGFTTGAARSAGESPGFNSTCTIRCVLQAGIAGF